MPFGPDNPRPIQQNPDALEEDQLKAWNNQIYMP